MRSWKDMTAAAIGLTLLMLANVYFFAFAKLSIAPTQSNAWVVKRWPNRLLPACDYYPNGLNGIPCADANEFERTGRLVLHEPSE